MKRYILLVLILCTYTHADTSATIIDYEKKAYFHEVAKEYGVALGYHEIVCDLGAGEGCANAATLYLNRKVDTTNRIANALKYYKKACDLNNAYGCYMLGIIYEMDIKNPTKSFYSYSKACELNNGYACTATAMFYKQGLTTKKDFKQALYYYKKACKLHDKVACDTLNSSRNTK